MISTLDMAIHPLQPNEPILYDYEHSLNGKSKTIITKHGVFVKKVKHNRKYWTIFHRKQMAVVKFIGNKIFSLKILRSKIYLS